MNKPPNLTPDCTARKRGLSGQAPDQIRANTYGLLAALLVGPPGPQLFKLLQEISLPDAAEGEMAATWRQLQQVAEGRTGAQVDDEYHALFIGLGRGELVPYGSWYLTGFLMEKPLALLRRDLARLGIERQPGVHEPEDHVAALCETMAVLISNAEEITLATQQQFFNQHFSPWMETFFRDLQMAPSAHFYRPVGQLGEQFIKLERQYLLLPA